MSRIKLFVFLAFAILAGCTKDETSIPVKPDQDLSQSPYGSVVAPYLVVSIQDGRQFRMERYRVDGGLREKYLDPYFSDPHMISDPDFSRKGEKLCYAEGRDIFILDLTSGNRQHVVGDVEDMFGIASAEMSPDGSKIAFLSWNNNFTVDLNMVASDGETIPTKLTNYAEGVVCLGPPSFSPDGERITYSEFPNIVVSDMYGSNRIVVHESTGLFESATYPIFNKDGSRLIYFLQDDYGISIVSPEAYSGSGTNAMRISQLAGSLITDPKFPVLNADGSILYFAGLSSGYTNLYKVPVLGGTPVKIASDIDGSKGARIVGLDFVEQ